MAYADYDFYKNEYFGEFVPESDFPRLSSRASDYLDTITYERLVDGLPSNQRSQAKIKKAVCAMCDILYQVGQAQKNAISAAASAGESVHTGERSTGIITGKSSGVESISYAAPSELAKSASAWSPVYGAAGDANKLNRLLYGAALPYLTGVCDDKGVCLLYAGIA